MSKNSDWPIPLVNSEELAIFMRIDHWESAISEYIMYSKASRYTASRSADLKDTRFLIGSQNTWDTRILAKSLADARFFFENSVSTRLLAKIRVSQGYCYVVLCTVYLKAKVWIS